MKKRIVMILLVTVMTAGVFTGCGNKTEGDGNIQAVMADAGNNQEDLENEKDKEETSPEATAAPTEKSAPEATAAPTPEPTEEPTSTSESDEGTELETAADSSEDADTDNSESTSQQSSEANNTTQGTATEGTAQDTSKTTQDSNQGTSQDTANNKTTAASATDTTAQGTDTTAQAQTSKALSQGFVNYLNQKRAAAGLSEITWNSGYESTALTRAEQLAANFSHDDWTVEIILATGSGDPASWWESWSESYGHNLVITDPTLQSGAAAYYCVNGYYYVVFVYDNKPVTAEDFQEMINSGEMEAASYYTGSDGEEHVESYVKTGSDTQTYSSVEDEQANAGYTPEQIEWLKSIGAW